MAAGPRYIAKDMQNMVNRAKKEIDMIYHGMGYTGGASFFDYGDWKKAYTALEEVIKTLEMLSELYGEISTKAPEGSYEELTSH